MKLGDMIKCANEADLKQTLKDLDAAGFHAVRDSYDGNWLRITGVPEAQYLVQSKYGNAYCDTLEEAQAYCCELDLIYGSGTSEILKGYPGEWEPVSTAGE